jgi:hypothetical protein
MCAEEPRIRLDASRRFEIVGLAPDDLALLKKADFAAARQGLFTVHVVSDDSAATPAMLGTLRLDGDALRFEPRFPLEPGVRYRAILHTELLRPGAKEVRSDFTLPRSKPAAATIVRHVYPTRDRLPENQLKFYLHFSAAMSRGEAYRHVQLLDEKGKPVELPFLELDEELWDPSGQRFTLFFDPGRIKRGVKPREDVGPSLIEGKSYTLLIAAAWRDAEGQPLKESFRKSFRVVAPEEKAIDLKDWKLETPAAEGRQPLTVTFPRPLDHALLNRLIWITDTAGRRIAGTIAVTEEETRWQFTPEKAWSAGRYDLVVDTTLEDLAGNSVGRPFELDVFRPIPKTPKTETAKRGFVIE